MLSPSSIRRSPPRAVTLTSSFARRSGPPVERSSTASPATTVIESPATISVVSRRSRSPVPAVTVIEPSTASIRDESRRSTSMPATTVIDPSSIVYS